MRISTLAGCCALALSFSAGSAQANNLMDVYQMSVENDPTIMASEYERRTSEAAVDLAKSARMPTIGATIAAGASTVHGGASTEEDDISTTVQAILPLYNRESNIGITRSRSLLDKADADHAEQRQSLISRTAEAYFGVLRAQDDVTFSKAELEAIFRQLDQAERRYEVGLVAITDVKEAQASHDSAVANVIAAENQLIAATENLRVMTNRYVDNLHVLREDVALLPPAPNDVELWVTTAKNQNPTLIAAREDLTFAKLGTDLASAGGYPTLDLIGSYQNQDISGTVSRGTEISSIDLRLTVPIYTGGAVSSGKRQAKMNALAFERTLVGTERNIERNVRTSFSTVEARISQVHALKRALESNQVRLEATEAGYDAGTRTAVDVLDAIRGTTSAAAQYAGSRYDYILAMLDLQAAVGSLDESDLTVFNDWLEPAKIEEKE